MGYSKPWPKVIRVLTGGKTSDIDAQPLIDYFKPLEHWLINENKAERIGWSRSMDDIGRTIIIKTFRDDTKSVVCLFFKYSFQHCLNPCRWPTIRFQLTDI